MACWQVQKEEILLLKSIYCAEGECVVTCCSTDGSGPPTVLTEETLTDTECPSERTSLCVSITLHIEAHFPDGIALKVAFVLPKGYPRYDPPSMSLSCITFSREQLMELTQKATQHSEMLVPEASLFDILEKIKDDVMGLRLPDPVARQGEVLEGPGTVAAGRLA